MPHGHGSGRAPRRVWGAPSVLGKDVGSFPHQLCASCTAWVPTAASPPSQLQRSPYKTQRLCVFSLWICFYGICGSTDPTPSKDAHRAQGYIPSSIPHRSHLTPISWEVWNTAEGKFFARTNATALSAGKSSFHQGKVLARSLSQKGEGRATEFCTDCKSESLQGETRQRAASGDGGRARTRAEQDRQRRTDYLTHPTQNYKFLGMGKKITNLFRRLEERSALKF